MDMRARVLSALRWNAAAKLSTQVLNWAITIFVIRLLAPEDFGLMAMTTVVVLLLTSFSDAGLANAVIQSEKLETGQLRKAQGIVWAGSLLAFALVVLAAPQFSVFFREDRLTLLIRVAAVGILIGAPGALPRALLTRDLRLRAITVVDIGAGLIGSLTSRGMAGESGPSWSPGSHEVPCRPQPSSRWLPRPSYRPLDGGASATWRRSAE
jgi:O-antigen/teichoic acid export membrane protein